MTELFMKDGDPQQHNEIKRAMLKYMTNAADAGCGWHIVHQGYKRNCPGPLSAGKKNKHKWEQVIRHIKAWVYSWMRPGYCESEEEYKISKELLFRYVSSQTVLDASGGNLTGIDSIKEWLRLITNRDEQIFLHYLRMDKRCLDTFCASAHEGTNFGLKNHSVPMKANASMTTTAKTLKVQAQLKTADLDAETYRNMTKSSKRWSVLPTSDRIAPYPEGLVHAVMDREDLYAAARVDERDFEVFCSEVIEPFLADEALNDSPIPRFRRIRRVTIRDDGVCKCSCCYFERVGIPCPHIAAVFRLLNAEWKGFLHTDLSVRWWVNYHYHAYRIPSHGSLTRLFHELRKTDKEGPTLLKALLTGRINERTRDLPAVERLKNYCPDDVSRTVERTIHGCILTSHIVDSQMDDENDILDKPLKINDPSLFVESISDVAGCSIVPGHGFRAAISGLVNELIQSHETCKDQALDEELADILRNRLHIARTKAHDKLPASETLSQTVSFLTDIQVGGHSRVYNTKDNGAM